MPTYHSTPESTLVTYAGTTRPAVDAQLLIVLITAVSKQQSMKHAQHGENSRVNVCNSIIIVDINVIHGRKKSRFCF